MTMPFAHHPLAQPASRAGRAAYRRERRWDVAVGLLSGAIVGLGLLGLGWAAGAVMMALLAAGG